MRYSHVSRSAHMPPPHRMSSTFRSRIRLWLRAWPAALLLAACAPASEPTTTPVLEVGVTPSATIAFPTFAPTTTLTPAPTLSPTPDVLSNLGPILFADDFSVNRGWPLGEAATGGTSLQNDRLVVAVRESRQFRIADRDEPTLVDFYAEVQMGTELCSLGDEFGILFRMNDLGEHYRYTLSCEGTIRVRRVLLDGSRALVSPEVNPAAFPGAPALNQIGVWALADRFRLFVNGVEILQARDGSLASGHLGFYVRAGRDGQTTVSFDDLLVRAMVPDSP
ncbi:MAG: hypothetical protein WD906_09575 [Anaerolineales bacterium]